MEGALNSLAADAALAVGVNLVLWAWLWVVPTVVVVRDRLFLGARGMALPGVILLQRAHQDEEVLRHELVHQAQMRRYTPLGAALLLGWHYGLGFLRARQLSWSAFMALYRVNPLEMEAHAKMRKKTRLPALMGWPRSR